MKQEDLDKLGLKYADDGTPQIYWLSFADDSGCLGIAIVEATNFIEAVTRARLLGINPGGECAGWVTPEEDNDECRHYLDRLISVEEARKLFDAKSIKEWKEDGLIDD